MTKKGRYDERDTLFARMAWREGSPAGEDYYKRNPEKKAIDNALRRMPDLGSPETPTWNPLASAVTDGVFRLLADWHPQVERHPNGPGLNLPPEDLSRWATWAALHFGADPAATLSMAASEYLSQRSEKGELNPVKAAVYMGIAYLITVTLLVAPYFIADNVYLSLIWALFDAFLVILFFSFFVSVVQDRPFKPAFMEMAVISFGVATLSFIIGLITRRFLPVDL